MAGLWTIPLFVVCFTGQSLARRFSMPIARVWVTLLGLLIFAGSEQFLWMLPSWYAQHVTMIGHVAIYIITPELILSLSTWQVYRAIQNKPHWLKLPAAWMIMQLYLGSAAFFYFLIEKVLR